jgi:hypothetical protein
MLGLFSKGTKSQRDLVIEEFQQALAAVNNSELDVQFAVSVAVGMANGVFRSRFPTTKAFRDLSYSARLDYLRSFTKAEIAIKERDPLAGLAFGLFKAWVGALAFNDAELERMTSTALEELSRKAPSSGEVPVQ